MSPSMKESLKFMPEGGMTKVMKDDLSDERWPVKLLVLCDL